jgi:RNA polymerase sigma factor (TIGR02999 family)
VSQADPGEVTRLLVRWSSGEEQALAELTPLVYGELRRIASRYLRKERSDHTLQATALVNEAYLRLVDQTRVDWKNSLHFMALASQMMRRILVDHARTRRYAKRGGGARPISLEAAPEVSMDAAPDLIEVDEALDRLAEVHPELARVVELRFFGGLKSEEIAKLLDLSVPTVTRRWRLARAWLYRHLSGKPQNGD